MATHGSQIHRNLPPRYELLDTDSIAERVNLMFDATEQLETEHDSFDQLFLEYESHALYARRLDDGILILVTEPMERAQFKKAKVGVNLFLKPLKKALAETPFAPVEPQPEPPTEDPPPSGGMIHRMYRGVRY